MKGFHKPVRTCAGCGGKFEKERLIRVVCGKDGALSVDRLHKSDGRGAYICGDPICFQKLLKNKRLAREFKMQIPDSFYDTLKDEIESVTTKGVRR